MRIAKALLLTFDLAIIVFIFGVQVAVIWGADKRWGETAYMSVGPLLLSAFGWLWVYCRSN